MKRWYGVSYKNLLNNLNSNLELGLNYSDVEKNREAFGKNIIDSPKNISKYKMIFLEIREYWSIAYLIFLLSLSYLGYTNVFLINLSIFLCVFFSFLYIDIEGEKKLNAIEVFNSSFVRVIREGREERIKSDDLVVGDIVFLDRDNYVPADIRLIQVENLKVNELAVTGENYIVEKFSAKLEEEGLNINEISNMVFKSTVVKDGTGIGVVVAVGMNTQIGSIMKVLIEEKKEKNSFFNHIKRILNDFSIAGSILSLIVLLIAYIFDMDKNGIIEIMGSLIFVAIPLQNIIFFIIFLFVYINSKKKKGIIFNNISSLKYISNIKNFFLDKNGMLSKDEMIINKIFLDDKLLKTTSKYNLDVEKFYGEKEKDDFITIEDSNNLKRLISISLLCNDASYSKEEEIEKGDVKEVAMIKFALNYLMYKNELNTKYPRVFEVPIEGKTNIKTIVNKIEDKYRANVVGNLDEILENSTHVLKNGIEAEISNEEIDRIKEAALDISIDGMDVVALAYRNFNYEPSVDENIESNLVIVGLMGIVSPIKTEAYDFKEKCNKLQLRPIIFTQDNKIVAKVFGKDLNIINDTNIIYSGIEFQFMSDREMKNILNKERIFSKLKEEHKEKIVQEYKNKEEFTAVLGSKLIELPHMTLGDVTIATGEKSSNIITKLSDIFIKDLNINKFFNLVYESKEVIKFYKSLIFQSILSSSTLLFSIILSLTLNKKWILGTKDMIYLNLIIIMINGITLFMQYGKNIFLNKESMVNDSVELDNISLSFLLLKGLFITILGYSLYLFALENYGEHTARLIFLFNLGLGLAFSPLNMIKEGLVFKNLLSNISMILSVLCVFFISIIQGNKVNFDFSNFIKQNYIFILVCVVLNYILNVLFRNKFDEDKELYMDYY